MIQISILRERNIYRGVVFSSLLTIGTYITISIISIIVGFNHYLIKIYLFADIYFALGTIFGVVITLKNRQEDQSLFKIGVISGLGGGILSSIFIGFYEMILWAIFYILDIFVFLFFFGTSIITGIVIGLLGGALIATYYMYKELKGEAKEDETVDDFLDGLKKK